MGQLHARVISESPLAELAAIVDVDQDVADRVASNFGVAWYRSVDAICEDREVDAAIVAVPDTAHEEPATRLLHAGKAVLLEKPMAHTLDAALHIAEAARSSRSRLMVGHILRFDPRYAGAAAQVAEGVVGQPLHVTASRFTFRDVGMRMAGRSSPCFYLGIHDIDAMQWVTGRRVTRLFALAVPTVVPDSSRPPADDAIFATCELEGGVVGNLQFGWTLPNNFPSGINAHLEVVGSIGSVAVDTRDHGLQVVSAAGMTRPDTLHWPETNQRIAGDLADEVNHFVASVCNDQDFLVPITDALRNVAVNDAIIRSIKSNAAETVELVAG